MSAPDERMPAPGEQYDLPIARREYFSIGDVCSLTGLRAHVLRYWEEQFPVLRPQKSRGGNRVFQAKDVELILLIKRLLHQERYTVEGARQRLDALQRSGDLAPAPLGREERALLADMKAELREILDVLTPPTPTKDE